MTYTSTSPEEFDRMGVHESHALAIEAQRYRQKDFEAQVDVLGNFLVALSKARVV